PDRQVAEDLSRELGWEKRVTFLGKLESVAELLACADLFLLPSEEESFGLVALEAMASGVPVIGSSGSGLSEVVTDGLTGRLHPVGDVEAMAESAVELLSDSECWSRVSRAARESAVERFSSDRIVPQYESFYEEVLAVDSS
ncbi:MAG: glycosyltransferase, partial [Gemmatimonadales bacterium]